MQPAWEELADELSVASRGQSDILTTGAREVQLEEPFSILPLEALCDGVKEAADGMVDERLRLLRDEQGVKD